MSSLTPWITSLTSTGTSLAWASPLTTGERRGLQQLGKSCSQVLWGDQDMK